MIEDIEGTRQELHALLADRAFRWGDFVLSSGRRSDFYFDGKQVTLDGRGLFLVATLILARCRELDIDAIGGLTLGADPIAAGVAALSGATERPLRGFIVREKPKAHGTGRAIEGPPLNPGDRVALVDDTTTTGHSFVVAHELVVATGAEIIEAIVVVDREEGARDALRERGMTLRPLYRRADFSARAPN